MRYGDDKLAYKVYSRFPESHFPGKTFPETVITLPDEIFVTYFSVLSYPDVNPQSVNLFFLFTDHQDVGRWHLRYFHT